LGELARQTLRSLVAPRRVVVALAVVVPIVAAQRRELGSSGWALPLLAATVVVLLVLAPIAYRELFALEHRRETLVLRVLAFGLLGLVAPLVLNVVPLQLGVAPFVSRTPTLLIAVAMFWAAGYALGRDIDLERRWQDASARALAASRTAEDARLRALRAQLDPHFLFNTLNAIAEWCREDALVAERALLSLSSLLRKVLSGATEDRWPLTSELDVVRTLFEIHRIRDPESLEVRWSLPEGLDDLVVPPLLLLPVAENAITHGPGRGHAGAIDVSVERDEERVRFGLENPGAFSGRRPGGHGIDNVERRLAAAFGADASFKVGAAGPNRTRADLVWPAEVAS
jgi:two-component system sensor histidine kinase AlgZ